MLALTRQYGVRYAAVIVAVGLAGVLGATLLRSPETRAPYVTFFPAVVVAALQTGFAGGVLATVGSGLLALYWGQTTGQPLLRDPTDWLGLVVFLGSGLLVCYICQAMYAAWADSARHAHREQSLLRLNGSLEKRMAASSAAAQELASELGQVSARERRRLAVDLHDGIGQLLVAAAMHLDALAETVGGKVAAEVQETRELLGQAIKLTRTLSFDLDPPVLCELGLDAALEWLCARVGQQHHLAASLLTDGQAKPLREDVRAALFQGARELLMNSATHSHGTHTTVSLSHDNGCVRLAVSADGPGYDPKRWRESGAETGSGLASIRQRLAELGGRIEFDDLPHHGTRVTLIVPCEEG